MSKLEVVVYSDDEMKHYGVKGMKWGVRNGESVEIEGGGGGGGPLEDLLDDLIDVDELKLQVMDKEFLLKTYANPDAWSAKPKDKGFQATQFVNNLLGDKRPPIERNVDFIRKVQDATRPARKFLMKLLKGNDNG